MAKVTKSPKKPEPTIYDMTMRDAFAAQALTGLCANPDPAIYGLLDADGEMWTTKAVRYAYGLADEMMARRSK